MRTVAAILLFGAVWQAVVMLTGVPTYILPPPLLVLLAGWANAGVLLANAMVTAEEVLLGLFLGTAFGVSTAVAMALSDRLRGLVRPALVVSQAVPVFALAPVLTLWLGYGLAAKIAMTVLIVFFPLASVFLDGLMATPESTLDLARLASATRWRTLLWLRLPHALPALASGLGIAAVYAPIGAVIGEWVGASQGLGYVMLMANARSHTDLMFAALLVLVALTLGLHRTAQSLSHWVAR
jgi:putative hydroxymethylpyrimidine transport system permease protein